MQLLELAEGTTVPLHAAYRASWMYNCPITCLVRSLDVQKVQISRISIQSAQEGGNVVSPTHRPPLNPQKILLVLFSVTVW